MTPNTTPPSVVRTISGFTRANSRVAPWTSTTSNVTTRAASRPSGIPYRAGLPLPAQPIPPRAPVRVVDEAVGGHRPGPGEEPHPFRAVGAQPPRWPGPAAPARVPRG